MVVARKEAREEREGERQKWGEEMNQRPNQESQRPGTSLSLQGTIPVT